MCIFIHQYCLLPASTQSYMTTIAFPFGCLHWRLNTLLGTVHVRFPLQWPKSFRCIQYAFFSVSGGMSLRNIAPCLHSLACSTKARLMSSTWPFSHLITKSLFRHWERTSATAAAHNTNMQYHDVMVLLRGTMKRRVIKMSHNGMFE